MENKNKSQYEWFKGPDALKQTKDWKQRGKEGFKWAKIFSYVALFTFSMFGCVQVFTVTTDNTIGRGIEIFHDEADIAPSVSETKFSKAKVFSADADGTKADIPDTEVFFSTTNQLSTIWINKNQDGDLLENIHTAVEENQHVSMKDAYKGTNSGITNSATTTLESVYDDKDGKEQTIPLDSSAFEDIFGVDPESESAEQFKDAKIAFNYETEAQPLVYSSASKNYGAMNDNFSSIPFYVPIQTSQEWDAVNEVYKPTFKTLEVKIELPAEPTDTEVARAYMAADILYTYAGGLDFDSPLFQFLGSKTEAAALALAEDTTYLDDWDSENISYINSSQFYRMTVLSQVLFAAGFEFEFDDMIYTDDNGNEITDKNTDVVTAIEYQPGKMVGYLSENTKWRPITSWGESFSLGPFYGFFVYPIGYITSNLIAGMGDLSGWESMMTIFLVVFTIRMLTFALSYKSTMAQSKMQDLNGKKAIIEAKYTKYEGNKQMDMRKRQEVADLYKKNGINPMASIGTMFLTMPFFLAIWRVIGGIPHLKAASWLGITFSATSYQEMFAGEWQYLPLIIIAAGIQLLSQLYPRLINRKRDKERLNAAQKEAMKKSNKTQNITMGVFVFMSVIFTAGIQIYWIIGGLWRLIEVRITHHLKEKKKQQIKSGQVK